MKKHTFIYAAAALLLMGMTACNNNSSKQNPDATAPVVTEGGLKVAYIDTDTLLARYQYAIDLEQQLKDYTEQQRRYGQQQVDAFQKDYNNYLQTGSTMTLTQQQAKEAELKQRAEKMQTLEQELMAKIAEKQAAETAKIMNAIYAFVREYNAANQQFDIIYTKQATLYINPAMDITDEIVNGLNEEYKNLKK
ncbi:MAG: OmpH family outer membrane protein [Bacteroidales bacterium]|nr:OmpH family outer membrane protein [Bacteroidales bacterium]